MDPRWLFPVLACVFLLAALVQGARSGRWRGSPATWAVLAAIFAAVSIWLRFKA